ncbi:outer membrane protein assembly factor BamB family protein [Amycolatopsis pigmentata]|uniref:PQQ-binding-like beta-propeller repeat protein n=1 Tax=Amycolatopsis pigmentata TaxID=450801 RepID=A0ABW5FZK6_9PSEU
MTEPPGNPVPPQDSNPRNPNPQGWNAQGGDPQGWSTQGWTAPGTNPQGGYPPGANPQTWYPPGWNPAPGQPAYWQPMPGGVGGVPPKPQSRKGLLIALLVVVVVIAGTGITLAATGVFSSGNHGSSSAGSGGGGSHAAKKLWAAPPVGADSSQVHGGWIVDDHTVAYLAQSGITGYDLTTGHQVWQVNPPAGQQVCAMSHASDSGIGAVGFGPDKDHCTVVAAIDAKAGKQLWTTQLTLPSNFQGYTGLVGALSVAETTVVVDDPETAFGFGAADGAKHWEAPKVPDGSDLGGDCTSLDALATGNQTAQILDCDSGGVKVVTYDTATGQVKWTEDASNDRAPGSWWLLSSNPVVAVDARTGMYYLPGQGMPPVPIGVTSGRYASSHHEYGTSVFSGTTMVTVDTGEQETMHTTYSVTAYDITTGKPLWTHKFDPDSSAVVAGLDNGNVKVDYTPPDSDDTQQILSFALADGAMGQGPTFGGGQDGSAEPLAVQLVDDKIVQFGSPKAPVTVWR